MHLDSSFYGVATIGTKGQIVIPADARHQMGMGAGDKVIIFGKRHPQGFGMVCVCPLSSAEQFVSEMTNAVIQTKHAISHAKKDTAKE